jgi:hypothetical protein
MKTVNLEEILVNVLNPVSHDCKTVKQDIHLALVFNPNVDDIYAAMREACNQAIDLAAEVQAAQYTEAGFTSTGKKINDSILNLKAQII